MARDATNVVSGKLRSTQPIGNVGYGAGNAAFTAEWKWKFTPKIQATIALRVVDGATQPNATIPKAWAAVRAADRSVIVEATTSPENSPAEWKRIQWSGPGDKAAYADPAFGILADQLEALLDAHATDTTAVRAAYGRAMRLELAFFEAAYALTPRRPR
jgi:hypothetical protein